jgi:small GTP-binding protein
MTKEVKVLITGPYRVGKSTLVRSMTSGRAINIDRRGTTVCMDYGYIDRDGIRLHLFGTPGQERFSIIREVLANGMRILVMVIDSTKPDSIAQAKKIFGQLASKDVPCIIAANKQDCPGAMTPAEVQRMINLRVPTVGTSAISRGGAQQLLSEMYKTALKVPASLMS